MGDFFVFCGNSFLRMGKTGFSCWGLIFAIFRKSRSNGKVHAVEIQVKQYADADRILYVHVNGDVCLGVNKTRNMEHPGTWQIITK